MEFLFRHTWILFIAVTVFNAIVIKLYARKEIEKQPELEPGYNKFFNGWMIYGNLPWVIMMIGDLTGMTQSTSEYLSPMSMNPIVLTFYLSVVYIWIRAFVWIFFNDGAAFIERHPGLIRVNGFKGSRNATAGEIKILVAIVILASAIALFVVCYIEIPK